MALWVDSGIKLPATGSRLAEPTDLDTAEVNLPCRPQLLTY